MNGRFAEFISSITEIEKSIDRIKKKEMRAFGLKGMHVMVLVELSLHEEGITAAAISRNLDLDKGAVSRVLAVLQEKNLIVQSSISEKRKYGAVITLTEAGRSITERMNRRIDTIVEQAGEGLREEERKTFYSVLKELAKNMKEISEEDI